MRRSARVYRVSRRSLTYRSRSLSRPSSWKWTKTWMPPPGQPSRRRRQLQQRGWSPSLFWLGIREQQTIKIAQRMVVHVHARKRPLLIQSAPRDGMIALRILLVSYTLLWLNFCVDHEQETLKHRLHNGAGYLAGWGQDHVQIASTIDWFPLLFTAGCGNNLFILT